jgi:hypothetical protein
MPRTYQPWTGGMAWQTPMSSYLHTLEASSSLTGEHWPFPLHFAQAQPLVFPIHDLCHPLLTCRGQAVLVLVSTAPLFLHAYPLPLVPELHYAHRHTHMCALESATHVEGQQSVLQQVSTLCVTAPVCVLSNGAAAWVEFIYSCSSAHVVVMVQLVAAAAAWQHEVKTKT